MSLGWRGLRLFAVAGLFSGVVVPLPLSTAAEAATLPTGFQEQVVYTGLNQPTNIEFAQDGRVFIAEKSGRIKVFDSLADPTPTLFADLSANVHNLWDRGLLGLALHPNFPADPWVYVLYTYDAPPGQTAPVWNDACPPDANNGKCVVTGRLSKLQANGNVMTGAEQVLIHDWCQQYPSHSIGDLHFGADARLYVTGGDGASFSNTDYGQLGDPRNPCGDPPGGTMSPPTAEGGALRSQDIRTTGDPASLDGTVLRLDPVTGAAAPGNPFIASPDLNVRRVVGYGLRNPFRSTIRPGTNELWIGDVGWNNWEEINRVVDPTAAAVRNFGWPCYEGNGVMASYDNANLDLCETLYTGAGQTQPHFTYSHSTALTGCGPNGGESITGLSFYPTAGGPYPAQYRGALFFADYSRSCIWAMRTNTPGVGDPNPANIELFVGGAAAPVDLAVGPGAELYYVDLGGTVRRIRYFPGNQPPTAVISAVPTSGASPLTVNFDATGSSDPDPADQGLLTYAWDFTNDGTTDATGPTATFTYSTAGTFTAKLTVKDSLQVADDELVTISSGNSAPTATMDTPSASLTWAVGDTINFSGHATDPQQGTLPASALHWKLRLEHCATPGNCHTHFLQEWPGVASGSFGAPDHEYPSHLELELIATDSEGLTHNVIRRLDPKTVDLTFATSPAGLQLTVGPTTQTAPFTRTFIQGSTATLSAPTPQTAGPTTYTFNSWSDGGAQTHVITVPTTAATYTASYNGSVPSCADTYGYTCVTQSRPFTPADATVLPLTGDDAYTAISLPFGFPFYGQSYASAWVSTNGFVSFVDPTTPIAANTVLPNPSVPNTAIYPFWDDIVVKTDSSIRTAVSGSAPNRQFVIEWRNVNLYGTSLRVSFEAILHENGGVVLNYSGISATSTRERGDSATVGIENASGDVALQYSANQPVLVSGTAIVISAPGGPPPSVGTVRGTVTDAATTAPIAGATVNLNPGGRTTTTNASGFYEFTGVPAGSYTLTASAPGGLGGSAPVTVNPGGTSTVNLALAAPGSYTVATEARAFVPADQTVLTLGGDEAVQQVALPFGFTYFGSSYANAWVSTNGFVSFVDPTTAAGTNSPLPSTAVPNLAVYGYWDDLVVKAGVSTVRTAVLGTAPNRQFVIEYRNVNIYRTSLYVTMEIILSESGEIAVNYADISATNTREQGDSATVGIENSAGDAAVQYSANQPVLRNGTAVVFRPTP